MNRLERPPSSVVLEFDVLYLGLHAVCSTQDNDQIYIRNRRRSFESGKGFGGEFDRLPS